MCILAGVLVGEASGADPENCLLCHRYQGLARIDAEHEKVHLYQIDPDYYDRALGPHARLKCTDCHERSEVSVIPHEPVSPVNCNQMCHLTQQADVEVRFSHATIGERLADSVHSPTILDTSNRLLKQPLGDGQSRCLLCHEEPTFRRMDESWMLHATPIARCESCHDETLPVDTDFMYWHVHARSRHSRSHADTARHCALCHANPAIREAFELPEVVASYAASFHGKAMLLGSEETAACLDCHASEHGGPHMILAQNNPKSSIHPSRLADTCRSPACHPTAGHRITTAAVHLDLATSRGIEFFIGALFIVLIVCTFGPSVVLQTLEMVQIVAGRRDPNEHRTKELAERLMATDTGRIALHRFTAHQRFQHWVLAGCFILLVVTGFPIKFADRAWASWVVDRFGGLPGVRATHRYAGAALLIAFSYHVLYVFISAIRLKRQTKQGWVKTIAGLPMLTNPREIRQFFQLLGYLLFIRKHRPEGDRFTLKEKFEYFGVFWGTVLLGITGLLMWFNGWTTQHFPGRVLTVMLVIHGFEAFLALLHVGVIHLIGVIFSPVVFPISKAMFGGDTPAGELAEVHAAYVKETAQRVGMLATEGGPSRD